MRYSFRNTLCGLAVIAAAGFLAEQANAQATVTLLEDDDAISFSSDIDFSIPEEISLFDEQVDVSLPSDGLISPAQAQTKGSADVIPMEIDSPFPATSVDFDDSGLGIDIEISSPAVPTNAPAPKVKSTTPPQGLIAAPAASGRLLGAPTSGFDENIVPSINDELFLKMSDLERQTTLLNLELKKERVQNEIAAVKAQRMKAQMEEEEKAREIERQRIEWENEQARLMVEEQRKLKEATAALEQLRQEKIVKEYKATMLENTQKWIKRNAEVYAKLAEKDEENKKLTEDTKSKISMILQRSQEIKTKATTAKTNHDRKVAGLEDQISILKARLEAEIENAKKRAAAATTVSAGSKKNPFAVDGTAAPLTKDKVKLSKEYAIMEIVGQGEELAARLINYDGNVFLAKVGTTLQNGYTIDEITQTYMSAVRDNDRDFLYFSAGGILDREPPMPEVNIKAPVSDDPSGGGRQSFMNRGNLNSTEGIPSLSRGMVIR